MRRTSIPLILALLLAGAVVGWLGQLALSASSSPTLTPPVTLIVALFGIAAIVVSLGWPIRQMMRGKRSHPVDPFFAMRVLVFAKATSLTGALLTGAAVGLTLYGLTRLLTPVLPALWYDLLTLAGAGAMLVAGIEGWQRVSGKLVAVEIAGVLALAILGAVIGTVLLLANPVLGWLVIGVDVVVAVVRLVIAPRRVRSIGYVLRADDLVFRRGILFSRLVAVPYGRMQLVDVNRGPVARLLGLAELRLVTAAATSNITIPGLPEPVAAEVRDLLIDRAEERRVGL